MRKRDFRDEVVKRLQAGCATNAQVGMALAVLYQISRKVRTNEKRIGVCEDTAQEIAEFLLINKKNIPVILQALEAAGAIERVKMGLEKAIFLTPEYLAAEEEDLQRLRGFIIPWGTPPMMSTVMTRMTEIRDWWLQLRATKKKPIVRPEQNQEKINAALRLVKSGLTPAEAARQTGVGRATVYREIQRLSEASS
jgi:DNA-binding MarR family transcriptional regulator